MSDTLKTWKIPVTWEMYGTVEVKAATIADAIKEFLRIENETEGFSLPTDGEYSDGSFQLSTEDEDELIYLIDILNK